MPLLAAFEDPRHLYLVMERADGGDLRCHMTAAASAAPSCNEAAATSAAGKRSSCHSSFFCLEDSSAALSGCPFRMGGGATTTCDLCYGSQRSSSSPRSSCSISPCARGGLTLCEEASASAIIQDDLEFSECEGGVDWEDKEEKLCQHEAHLREFVVSVSFVATHSLFALPLGRLPCSPHARSPMQAQGGPLLSYV